MKKKTIASLFEIFAYFVSAILIACVILPALFHYKGYKYREDGIKGTDFIGSFAAESAPADVLLLGSSHLYSQLIPMQIWESGGIPTFHLRSSVQPIAVSYHYLVEALKKQTPSLVALDLYMLDHIYAEAYEDTTINQTVIYEMGWSRNTLELIRDAMPAEQRRDFFLPLNTFHNRWKALEAQDYAYLKEKLSGSFERDFMKGGMFMFAWKEDPLTNRFSDQAPTEIPEDIYQFNYAYIRKITALCAERDIPFLLMMAVYTPMGDAAYRLEKTRNDLLADGFTVPTLNFNDYLDAMNVRDEDMWDALHMKPPAALRVSSFFAGYLKERYGLPDRRGDERWRTWARDEEKFADFLRRRMEQFYPEISTTSPQ